MRYAARQSAEASKAEMTPMIDMTFQLIAFFMVVVNFSETNQEESITLPLSELAKPPEAASEAPIMLQVSVEKDENGRRLPGLPAKVIFGGSLFDMSQLRGELLREKQILEATGEQTARMATVIIRADGQAQTGEVQDVIRLCQENGFEKYVLRAKQVSVRKKSA